MASFMDSIYAGKDRFVQDQERKRQETTRKLFGDALQNKPDALTQLYGVDPATAMKAQDRQRTMKTQGNDDRVAGAQFMHRAATVIKSTPDDQKHIVYSRLIQEAKNNPNVAEFTQGLPDQYDPSIMQHVDGLIGMAGMYEDQSAQGQETWMNGGNGTMISNRGNSKPIEGYVQRPTGGIRSGSKLTDMPRKLSDEEITTYANQMAQSGMPDQDIQNWMVAMQSMPDVQMGQPAKPAKLSALRDRIALAREMGATPQELNAIVMGGGKGGKAPTPAKLPKSGEETVDAKKTAGFLARMENAQKEIDRVEASGYIPGGIMDTYSAGQGLRNYLASPQGQEYRQAQENWVRANLRLESGAAIPPDEMDKEISNYFPQPGDGKSVIEQKTRNRLVTQEALRKRSGEPAPNMPNQADAEMKLPRLDNSIPPEDQALINKYLK